MSFPNVSLVEMDARLERLKANPDIDVVILGAGINGAGLFRDLSAQGVNCLMVDKGDYGSGTSAAPSRLIHGGLKYLETGEFGLVAQSTLERNLLLQNAPHYVTALPTMIPIFSWTKGIGAAIRTLFGSTTAPRSRGALLIKIGLSMYDYYGSRNKVMPRHRMTSRADALRDMPALTNSIVATGIYYDAKVSHPERLVLELLTDGMAVNPQSIALNYTFLKSSVDGLLQFEREGAAGFAVRPKLVVNSAGPWIDAVNATLGATTKLIGGTKGSHLLLKNDALVKSLGGQMIYFEADDGRICLVFDYQGLALVGSTDIKASNPDSVRADKAEIDYLIASVVALLPGLEINHDQIVYAYSGIRPLPASDAANPGLISRDHSAPVLEGTATRPFPIISLVGGKWTTFRGFAEEVADTVLKRLSRSRLQSTRSMAIGGGKDYPVSEASQVEWFEKAKAETGLTVERLGILLKRYGTAALAVAQHEQAFPDAACLPDSGDYSFGEIDYLIRREHVQHLSDIVMRRSVLAITGSLTQADLVAISELAASVLGWSDATRIAETEAVLRQLRETNLMRL